MHEFMHFLGFEHEHQKMDIPEEAKMKAELVQIALLQQWSEDMINNNIRLKIEGETHGFEYDPKSIMHYQTTVNCTTQTTLSDADVSALQLKFRVNNTEQIIEEKLRPMNTRIESMEAMMKEMMKQISQMNINISSLSDENNNNNNSKPNLTRSDTSSSNVSSAGSVRESPFMQFDRNKKQ